LFLRHIGASLPIGLSFDIDHPNHAFDNDEAEDDLANLTADLGRGKWPANGSESAPLFAGVFNHALRPPSPFSSETPGRA
jgi:hypothetical protein